MMCSESELGLKEKSEGILILQPDVAEGKDINEILGLSDCMLDVNIMPNRPDLLSITGLAREASAVIGLKPVTRQAEVLETGGDIMGIVSASVEDPSLCYRYSLRAIEGVAIGESPEFMKKRLLSHGIRSINNVVDATNYIMLLTGHPLHAFDLDRINGAKIIVRNARQDESIETIDGKKRQLKQGVLVIADGSSPVAVAGIMGGKATEVTNTTKRVLLEAASFNPQAVRRASKTIGLSSDSSYRFERGVDREGVLGALNEACSLILRLAGGGIAKGSVDEYAGRLEPKALTFDVKKAGAVLGVKLTKEDAKATFERLGIAVSDTPGDSIKATLPSYRPDLKEDIDLIEEYARLFGYNNIPEILPQASYAPAKTDRTSAVKSLLRDSLSGLGLFEAVNYSFVSMGLFNLVAGAQKHGVRLLNPLSEDQSMLRMSLIPSLLECLKLNLSRKNEDVRLFEIAPVFSLREGERLPLEEWKVAGLLYGQRFGRSWNKPKDWVDFFDAKGIIERVFNLAAGPEPEFKAIDEAGQRYSSILHPCRGSVVMIDGSPAGVLGEAHPDVAEAYELRNPVALFELDIPSIARAIGKRNLYKPLPRFPQADRDIAFVVDKEVPFVEIVKAIKGLDAKLIENLELFDVYCGESVPAGKKSLAIRITYRSMERTLASSDIDQAHARVAEEIAKRFNAIIRDRAVV
jgi:phenylalanyl-tRNA synthetase beta chain